MIRRALGRLFDPCLRLIAGEQLTVWGLLQAALRRSAAVAPSIHTATARRAKQLRHFNETGRALFRGLSDLGNGYEPTVHYEGFDPLGQRPAGKRGIETLARHGSTAHQAPVGADLTPEGRGCCAWKGRRRIRAVATPLAAASGVVQNDATGRPARPNHVIAKIVKLAPHGGAIVVS